MLIYSVQESMNALLKLRRHIKEKELEALLAGEHDSCSCFIEVNLYASSFNLLRGLFTSLN